MNCPSKIVPTKLDLSFFTFNKHMMRMIRLEKIQLQRKWMEVRYGKKDCLF
jgi:hypothetical protein